MNRSIFTAMLGMCAWAAEAPAEPWSHLHQQPKPQVQSQPTAEPRPQSKGAWKCESAAWNVDEAGNAFKSDTAEAGPYDRDGKPTRLPTDHGAFSTIAFARPGATLINGSCFIDNGEGEDASLPAGVALTRSSAVSIVGTQGWRCSAILPYYTDHDQKKPSMKLPSSNHLPRLTIKAAVSYCYVDADDVGRGVPLTQPEHTDRSGTSQ